MEEETGSEYSIEKNESEEREQSLERLLKQINVGFYFPKHKHDAMKTVSAILLDSYTKAF